MIIFFFSFFLSNASFIFQLSAVIQDVLRVFVIRIACLNLDYASVLMKPIISWISNRLLEPSMFSDVDAYKVISVLILKILFLFPCT